ncbi:hypothetical protein GCM10027053_23020 [Intrasporangium mesophilum]
MSDIIELTPGHGLGVVRTMPQFRTHIAGGPLTQGQRRTLLDQAELLLDGIYVHLPLKRAMHAIDPLQSLRLLRHRLPELSETEFHVQLQRIFLGLHDLHTNYILPSRFAGFAFLGVFLEKCVKDGSPSYVVTKTFDHITGDPRLKAGVEVTHWNGTPIAIAVAANAAREAGSNRAAQMAQGLQNMTIRAIDMSLPPDEDWVELTYEADGQTHTTRIPWRVFESAAEVTTPGALPSLPSGVAVSPRHLVGMDLRTELTRQVKRRLFAPASFDEERRVAEGGVPEATPSQAAAGIVPTTRPKELKARTIETSHGTFGHLRIFTFHMVDQKIAEFVEEVGRLLSVLPSDGLILDVRGNGGGYVIAAEYLLQFFTPRQITPEPMQFVSTRSTASLTQAVGDYGEWKASLEESVTTGAAYSTALPLYATKAVNSVGQLYHGPVVLVTDAQCYSACDIFAAGFQDHEIGPVLGVDANTGAGGANVVTHDDLRGDWVGGPLRPLPKGAQMRVALRRCLRVGARFGQPVEDLGVIPDSTHDLTRRDLLEDNIDLMEAAGALLAGRTPRVLQVEATPGAGKRLLKLTTKAVASVDVYVNGRPVLTTATVDGENTVTITTAAAPVAVRIEGFDTAGQLVAARRIGL